MTIDQKWKTFALLNVLSDWDTTTAPVLYDFLTDTDSDSLADLFEEHGIVVWQPFEFWQPVDIVDLIVNMATQAQQTAEAA